MTGARIVLVFGSGFESGHGSSLSNETSRLGSILERPEGVSGIDMLSVGMPVRMLRRGVHLDLTSVSPGWVDAFWRRVGGERLRLLLGGSPLGRLLNSMGPLEAGRVFWRRVRRSAPALEMFRRADIVVAVDSAGVITAARLLRRRWVREAYYDTRSAAIGRDEVVAEASS